MANFKYQKLKVMRYCWISIFVYFNFNADGRGGKGCTDNFQTKGILSI